MSQIKFNSTYGDNPVEVMAGWDRPLSGFFMTIFIDLGDNGEHILYSALDDPEASFGGNFPDTVHLKAKLREYIPESVWPVGFWEKVELREGNVTKMMEARNVDG